MDIKKLQDLMWGREKVLIKTHDTLEEGRFIELSPSGKYVKFQYNYSGFSEWKKVSDIKEIERL